MRANWRNHSIHLFSHEVAGFSVVQLAIDTVAHNRRERSAPVAWSCDTFCTPGGAWVTASWMFDTSASRADGSEGGDVVAVWWQSATEGRTEVLCDRMPGMGVDIP